MYEGTTPTIPITFRGIDLSEAKIYVTIETSGRYQMTFVSGEDFTVEYDGKDTTVGLRLTQENTLDLGAGNCYIQARYVFQDGTAGATKRAKLFINPVLLKDVIDYGS